MNEKRIDAQKFMDFMIHEEYLRHRQSYGERNVFVDGFLTFDEWVKSYNLYEDE